MSQSLDNFQLYQKFNQLIESSEVLDQDLLLQINRLKRSVVLSQRVKEDFQDTFGQGRINYDLEEIQKCLDMIVSDEMDRQGLLVRTENAFFRQMISLRLEVFRLQEEIKLQHERSDKVKKRLTTLKKNPDLIFNSEIQRQENLIFKQSDFQKIKEEIKQIQIKIETIQLLDEHIDAKIDSAKQKNQELEAFKLKITSELNDKRVLLKEKNNLLEQAKIKKEEIQKNAREQKQMLEKKIANEMIVMLRQRLELQDQMEQEEAEKDQFLNLLVTFKEKYDETQKKNKKLKEKFKKNGFASINLSQEDQ